MKIEFYETDNCGCPLSEFLNSLSPKMLAKTLRTIDLLEQNGSLLRTPYSEYLKNGIFELRTKQSSNITRILYFFVVGDKAVLTNGFTKKTKKTPTSEVQLATNYKEDYLRRNRDELQQLQEESIRKS